jgi:hypothetical protein
MDTRRKKTFAIPNQGRQPSFEEVADIALTAAAFNQAVCVLCWNQALQERWMYHLDKFSTLIPLLDVLDANQAMLDEWKVLLGDCPYDIIVMHGIQTAYQAEKLTIGYVMALVDEISAGLVIWA